MVETLLRCPPPFHLRDVVFSHGWVHLPPNEWDEETQTLTRTEVLPSGEVVRFRLSPATEGVLLRADSSAGALPVLSERARWMLAMDLDLTPFHALCTAEPGLRAAAERGKGRVFRSPTVWEDAVKTLLSTNTMWRQTIAMTKRLVQHLGSPHADGGAAFPEPDRVAAAGPEELKEVCRVGYRAESLVRLAQEAVSLEDLKRPGVTAAEAEARLRSLHGIGPYAAANLLLLLGHGDHLPVDSWFRTTVRRAWFGGEEVPDSRLAEAFERFRPYRALAYYFYDWAGADRREVWDPAEPAAGRGEPAGQ